MDVITISRQMGSSGYQVGVLVAKRLGYRLVWRDLINQAARRAGTPEVALAAMDELGLLGMCPSQKACRAYHRAVEQVIRELAEEKKVVIVGRAGQAILSDRPNTLHVRVIAPLHLRARRIAREHGITMRAALAQARASDEFRHDYLHRYYGVDWDEPSLYDVIVNTARLEPKRAADLICLIARERTRPSIPSSRELSV